MPQSYHNYTNPAQQDCQNNAFNDNDVCSFGNLEPLCVLPSVIRDDVDFMQDYSGMEYKDIIADSDYVTKPTHDYPCQLQPNHNIISIGGFAAQQDCQIAFDDNTGLYCLSNLEPGQLRVIICCRG
ncbi:hypothetical protein FRX31_004481 [Thalictrum thalictroides]|uniref:Uncharacterized protein n=1 Tax=Thalictrum thalictroides TaxID=46969 RepID=A0A7J6X820_THATH|nr:hypothetical protein FRX31_004481 [Thalictrum thalictroides]